MKSIDNENVRIDLSRKEIFFKAANVNIQLSSLQCRFICQLLSGVTKKNDLIEKVWIDKHRYVSDNNYHQLVHQFRKILSRNGISPDVIRTVHRHGVTFDQSLLSEERRYPSQTQPSLENELEKKEGNVTVRISLFSKFLCFFKSYIQ